MKHRLSDAQVSLASAFLQELEAGFTDDRYSGETVRTYLREKASELEAGQTLGKKIESAAMGTSPVFRLTVRCCKEPNLHAKMLRMSARAWPWIEELGRILDGSSKFYMRKVGDFSPIGKCCTCGAAVEVEITPEKP